MPHPLLRHRRLIRMTAAVTLCATSLIVTGCKSTTTSTTQPAVADALVVTAPPTTKPIALAPVTADGMVRGVLAYPTGDRATSSLLLEKAVPAEIISGKAYSYDLKVTNLTKQTLENVEVVESVPEGMKLGDKVDGATLNLRDGTARIGLGNLKAGETRTVAIPATAGSAGQISTCANVTYATSLCVPLNVVSPALKVATTLPAETLLCNQQPLTIDVTNTGTGTVRGAKLAETLAEGMTTLDGQSTFAIDLGDIAAGETKKISVPVKFAKTGELAATAKVTAAGDLSADAKATTTARQPVLTITKSGPEKNYIGVPYDYTITIANKGDAPAANTVVTDTLPQGLTAVAASDNGVINSNNTVTWNVGLLEKTGTKTLKLTVRGDAAGTARNSVGVTASCAAPAVVTADTQLVGVPALLVEVVDDPDPIRVGDQVTYTIRITNQGSAPQTNLAVSAELEAQMEAITANGVTPGKIDGAAVAFDKLATLAPRAKAEWTVLVKAKDVADVRFKVKVLSDQSPRSINEEESSNFYK